MQVTHLAPTVASNENIPWTGTSPGADTPDCVIIFDDRGRIRRFDPEAERLFRYREADVLSWDIGALMPAHDGENRDRRDVLWPDRHQSADPAIEDGLIVIGRRSDNGTFPMAVNIRDLSERLFAIAIRDLTLSVEREARVQALQAELAQTARVGELYQLSSTLLDRVIRPLRMIHDDFSYNRGLFDQEAARLASTLLSEVAGRASKMIVDLRALPLPDGTPSQPEDLREVIEIASGQALAGVRQPLTLRLRLASDATAAVIDRAEIQRVLRHLIRDAERAMAASPRREILVSTARVGDAVEISVADSGPLLAAPIRPGTFRPLADGDAPFRRAVVAVRGYEILADEIEGGGAVFRLTISANG